MKVFILALLAAACLMVVSAQTSGDNGSTSTTAPAEHNGAGHNNADDLSEEVNDEDSVEGTRNKRSPIFFGRGRRHGGRRGYPRRKFFG